MRTALLTMAAAVSALAVATPASAQYFPVSRGYIYHPLPYNYGHARALKARLDYVQREIRRLAHFRMISPSEYHNLMRDSREIEYRLIRNARDGFGLSPQEAYATEWRMVRLEQRIARDVRDGRRWAYRW